MLIGYKKSSQFCQCSINITDDALSPGKEFTGWRLGWGAQKLQDTLTHSPDKYHTLERTLNGVQGKVILWR